jgi:hypothetical protein
MRFLGRKRGKIVTAAKQQQQRENVFVGWEYETSLNSGFLRYTAE